jgi:hypothetical protein
MYKSIVILIIFLLGLYFIFKSNTIETFTDTQNTGMAKHKIAENCPDVLIQKGSSLFLYNSKRGSVPGVNPIRFENLEEYVEFTEWQRSQGILCPVLFLQHAYNAQGEPVYKARPSPTNLQGGLQDYYVDQNSLPNGVVTSETIANIMNNPNIMPAPKNYPLQGYGAAASIDGYSASSFKPPQDGGANSMSNNICGIVVNDKDNYPGYNTQALITGEKTALEKTFKASPNPMDDNWGGLDFTEKLVQSGYYADDEVSISI